MENKEGLPSPYSPLVMLGRVLSAPLMAAVAIGWALISARQLPEVLLAEGHGLVDRVKSFIVVRGTRPVDLAVGHAQQAR
jgi:hypothetical protein